MDVFQYLDPYLVLQNYYHLRKQNEEQFSYAKWSAELNVQSASTLRMMIHGKKRISSRLAEKFSEIALKSLEERNYFRLLVLYVHAATTTEKNVAWAELSKILSNQIEVKEVRDYLVFLSDPLLPKLQTLLSFEDQVWNISSLSAVLGADPQTLQEAVQKLEVIGLAERIDRPGASTAWKSKSRLTKVDTNLGDLALRAYHNASLDEAKAAQNLPVETRRYRSLLIPLSKDEFQNLRGEVESFLRQTLSKYQSDHYRDRLLYQFNLNFYPISSSLPPPEPLE